MWGEGGGGGGGGFNFQTFPFEARLTYYRVSNHYTASNIFCFGGWGQMWLIGTPHKPPPEIQFLITKKREHLEQSKIFVIGIKFDSNQYHVLFD